MSIFEVDKKTCRGDGKCVEICPVGILRMNEKERVPEFIPGGEELCINCGHCFAFCPPGSIRLAGMGSADALRLDHSQLPGAVQLELLLKGRRSIRTYKDDPVSRETIEKLLDMARYAPSGTNRQPVNWAVLSGRERVRETGGLVVAWMEGLLNSASPMAVSLRFDRLVEAWKNNEDRICRGAPCLAIAYGLKDDFLAAQSCLLAGTYLELAAFGMGLGACWAGYVNMAINESPAAKKFAGLSPRAAAGAVMMLGYPKYRYSRIPSRKPVKVLWR